MKIKLRKILRQMIDCACGCGQKRINRDEKHTYKYIKGHHAFKNNWGRNENYFKIHKFIGKDNKKWKGENVGYWALHDWVQRQLGTPETCEHCGQSGLKGQQIHWANKSRRYLRDITDWLRLCRSCHRYYDLGKIVIA